jgi:Fic family protein
LLGTAQVLDPALSQEAWRDILTEDALSTAAIEGQKLDPAGLRSSISRNLGLPTAGLPRPSREADGLVQVLLDATRNHDAPLTLKRLLAWQAALFPTGYSGLHRIRAGKLRGRAPMQIVSGPVGYETVHFEAVPRDRLAKELSALLRWLNADQGALDGLMKAGLAHLWFETIHPFEDGNGRVGRALCDMVMARDEKQATRLYSLSAQFLVNRAEYYAQLERAQRGTLDVTEWLTWFLGQVAEACDRGNLTVERTLAKARFWLRHRDTAFNDRQRKALNRLLDAPDFEGGMTNRKYASLTRASRVQAYRDLADLVDKGCLQPLASGGRSTAYRIKSEAKVAANH